MRLKVIAVLAFAGFLGAGGGPARAEDSPACTAKASEWETLRESKDLAAVTRFKATIPASCTLLRLDVERTLTLMAEMNRDASAASTRGASRDHASTDPAPTSLPPTRGLPAPATSGGGLAAAAPSKSAPSKAAPSKAAPPTLAKPSGPPTPTPSRPTPSGTPSASLPPAVALPAGYEIVSRVLAPTESYLPKRDGMPTGVVLLDVREKAKNQSLCKALLGAKTASVKTEAQARRDNPNGDFLVTNWPVMQNVGNEGDCAELLAKYDFERSGRIKSAYALTNSRGPIFLALDPTGELVYLDLKDASPEDVFKATSDWMKLALAAPQNRPAAEQRLGLIAGTNRLFAKLAGGFGSLLGANPTAPTFVRFNDPVKGTARQFNVYQAGVYLIGATFKL